jgi:phage shock protein C
MERRLYRSRNNKVIAGVCGGLAEYFNIDPVIVRIIAVALLLPGGLPGFLPYAILWLVVPYGPDTDKTTPAP